MAQVERNLSIGIRWRTEIIAWPAVYPVIAFCFISALFVVILPIQASIATVMVFAGPHNWIEFRYFLQRMPARWGKLRLFYATGLGGVVALTAGYVFLFAGGQSWYLNDSVRTVAISIWNTAAILWAAVLILLRGKHRMNRDWSWALPVAFLLCGFAWIAPLFFSLALVYLHPLVALWFLDRELRCRPSRWRRTYRICLAILPVFLVLIWISLAKSADLDDSGSLAWRITQHAGAGILTNVSSHLLVATHVFLESIHYGVWLILIPLVGLKTPVWRTSRIPLAAGNQGWPKVVNAVLAAGVFGVVFLWVSFSRNYAMTRDLYFTFAIAHVLAEAPFLIRML